MHDAPKLPKTPAAALVSYQSGLAIINLLKKLFAFNYHLCFLLWALVSYTSHTVQLNPRKKKEEKWLGRDKEEQEKRGGGRKEKKKKGGRGREEEGKRGGRGGRGGRKEEGKRGGRGGRKEEREKMREG